MSYPRPMLRPAASQPTTGPSTRPVDAQLGRAVEVLTAMAVLKEKAVTGPPSEVAPLDDEPSTRPRHPADDATGGVNIHPNARNKPASEPEGEDPGA